jgi:hypothetical protein
MWVRVVVEVWVTLPYILVFQEAKMRTHRRLSPLFIKSAKPGLHADGGNLYLQITDSGAKSWVFRYERNGRERWMAVEMVAPKQAAWGG